jgi:hypothetical protein
MAMVAALEHQSGRLPDLERQLRCDQTIGAAPNPVRPEILAAHISPSSYSRILQTIRQEASNARHHGVYGL